MSEKNAIDTNQPYVVIYTSTYTKSIKEPYMRNDTITRSIDEESTHFGYFSDLGEAVAFRAEKRGVLLKNLVVDVTEAVNE